MAICGVVGQVTEPIVPALTAWIGQMSGCTHQFSAHTGITCAVRVNSGARNGPKNKKTSGLPYHTAFGLAQVALIILTVATTVAVPLLPVPVAGNAGPAVPAVPAVPAMPVVGDVAMAALENVSLT